MDPISGMSTVALAYGTFRYLLDLPVVQIPTADRESAQKVLSGGDEEASNFRQSVTNECNMTAVAVNISLEFITSTED